MGCDIHILIEYRDTKDYPGNTWNSLYYTAINPGRNYEFFNKLSGVRGSPSRDNDKPIATAGWPEEMSITAFLESVIKVNESGTPNTVTMETAERWINSGLSQWVTNPRWDGISAVTNPDWHSYGHCSVKEMGKALRGNSYPEYNAMMAAARSLEKDGMEVRFLFFYDN